MPRLSRENAKEKSLCLKKRRELRDDGVVTEKLKIRNFKLFNDGKKILLIEEEGKTDWLIHMKML